MHRIERKVFISDFFPKLIFCKHFKWLRMNRVFLFIRLFFFGKNAILAFTTQPKKESFFLPRATQTLSIALQKHSDHRRDVFRVCLLAFALFRELHIHMDWNRQCISPMVLSSRQKIFSKVSLRGLVI